MYKIISPSTGRRASRASYPTRRQAEQQILVWIKRQSRGTRPDISLDYLLELDVAQEAGD